MKSLFFRTLIFSVVGLILFLAILSVFLFLGFNRSLESWSTNKLKEIREGVETKLLQPESDISFPQNPSVFIYGMDESLIYSNRGEGRKRSFGEDGDVEQVIVDNELIGYYHIGNISFQNDYANQQFVSSMVQALWIGALISCLLSALYALLFSRNLAGPARAASKGIRAIAGGNLDWEIPEAGTKEIAEIARAANDLRKQLKNERLLRTQWAEDVSHDLRTPISALKAQFEGMNDGVLPLTRERIIQNFGEIQRVEKLINNLQELMQLENPEMVLNRRSVNLADMFSSVSSVFAYQAKQKKVEIAAGSDKLMVDVDEDLLHRALANVVSNAIRHVDTGGTIRLQARMHGPDIRITIQNTGDPIEDDELNRVFDRLFRGDKARNTPGTGLGLTITRQIVERHGGTISIASNPEAGTIVTIDLHKNFT